MRLVKNFSILKIKDAKKIKVDDHIINEKLFSIRINTREIINLYCLPVYLKELSLGILYQEKIVTSLTTIKSISINENTGVIDIFLKGSNKNQNELDKFKKTRFLTPDCTNPVSLSSIEDEILCNPVKSEASINNVDLFLIVKQFNKKAKLFRLTGGTHSAAICSGTNILFYNEDISRHNCIDKLIGWSFLKGIKLSDKIIITTGRISASMVVKVVKASIPILISRSAATSEAIDIANRYNISMAGFARGSRFNIYTHSERFLT